jgi:hypothetical protein
MKYLASLCAALWLGALLTIGSWSVARAEGPWQYVSPRPGARLVSPGTTIVLREGSAIAGQSLSPGLFHVAGMASGNHAGQVRLADDGATIVFRPELPFAPGEVVTVSVAPGITTAGGRVLAGIAYTFTTWRDEPGAAGLPPEQEVTAPEATPAPRLATSRLTLPMDFPGITVTTPLSNTAEGYLFLTNVGFGQSYMLMVDNTGEPVYYQRLAPSRMVLDFTKQPNGQLTYFDAYYGRFFGLDNTYTVKSTYQAGNGYQTDHHDLQILPNGHYQLMIWDGHTVDMSKIVAGGKPDAWVIGLTVQEIDTQQNVVFEWRSWDHIALTETLESLTDSVITPVHGNALEPDYDGNILVSCRNLDAIIKIDRQTGDILWRLGGKLNDFTFVNDEGFHRQHDIRRLADGDITLFDNRTLVQPLYSRAVEYRLDEVHKTATRVWEYRHTPDLYAPWVSNVQQLPNGDRLVSWGLPTPNVTEVTPGGTPIFELGYTDNLQASYRVFRFPWQGYPTWPPVLLLDQADGENRLHFSWNGATEVASYRILAGNTRHPDEVIGTVSKQGFETTLDVSKFADYYCYFQVLPIDRNGRATTYSNLVYNSQAGSHCRTTYLPLVSH